MSGLRMWKVVRPSTGRGVGSLRRCLGNSRGNHRQGVFPGKGNRRGSVRLSDRLLKVLIRVLTNGTEDSVIYFYRSRKILRSIRRFIQGQGGVKGDEGPESSSTVVKSLPNKKLERRYWVTDDKDERRLGRKSDKVLSDKILSLD